MNPLNTINTIQLTPLLGWAVLVSVCIIAVYSAMSAVRRRRAQQRAALELARLRAQHVRLTDGPPYVRPEAPIALDRRSVH